MTTSPPQIDLSKPIDLVALQVKQRAIRCRLPGDDHIVTLRTAVRSGMVPGQILTVEPRKSWQHAGHPYLSGTIVSVRIDAEALGLEPLGLRELGIWNPEEEYWGEDGENDDWAAPIIERGPRPCLEMEQVVPGRDPEDFDSDPVFEAVERKQIGDFAGAREILQGLAEADLRCLDAHAHLGNLEIDWPRLALPHYEVGVRIGELSLGDDFDGVLPWGLIDNRPFLRCLHGLGLCLWRLQSWDEAEMVFERMLWLNPSDNQGARTLLRAVRDREPWSEA